MSFYHQLQAAGVHNICIRPDWKVLIYVITLHDIKVNSHLWRSSSAQSSMNYIGMFFLQICRGKLAVDVCDFSAQDCIKAFPCPQSFSPYAGDGAICYWQSCVTMSSEMPMSKASLIPLDQLQTADSIHPWSASVWMRTKIFSVILGMCYTSLPSAWADCSSETTHM